MGHRHQQITQSQSPRSCSHHRFSGRQPILDGYRARAGAVAHRFTDRLPVLAPTAQKLSDIAERTQPGTDTHLSLLPPDSREALAHASRASASQRRYDTAYHAELRWWTTEHHDTDDGIPAASLLTPSEADRVAVARDFPPVTTGQPRRATIPADEAAVFVLASYSSSRLDLLRCGQTLSALLLEATIEGLSTCIVSHVAEAPAGRALIKRLINDVAEPQALVRVGVRTEPENPARTPRRVDDVFEIIQ